MPLEECPICHVKYWNLKAHMRVHNRETTPNPPVSTGTGSLSRLRQKFDELAEIKIMQDFLQGKPIQAPQSPNNPQSNVEPMEIFKLINEFNNMRGQIKDEIMEELEGAEISPEERMGLKALDIFGQKLADKGFQTQLHSFSSNPPTAQEGEKKMNGERNKPLPTAAEMEEYKRKVKSGEINEEQAWKDFIENYPQLAEKLPREKFHEEFEKIKNS